MLTYIFIVINQGSVTNAIDFIKKLAEKNINKLFFVYGEFDIVLKLKTVNEEQVSKIVKELKKNQDIKSLDSYFVKDKLYETNVLPKVR